MDSEQPDKGEKAQAPTRRLKADYFAQYHNLLKNQEKREILTPQIKNLIIDSPLERYKPVKIRLRNEVNISIDRGPKPVYKKECGWASNPLSPYKTLGNLELDVETLLRGAMNLSPVQKSLGSEADEEEADSDSKVEVKAAVSRLTTGERLKRQSNGFDLLKARIAKSKANLATVKVQKIVNDG
jgi:hypothetical protein